MSTTVPPDDRERQRALDPGRSFLVQAPAGAGKTELLIQRYLALLALADEPEEILAVTFTRKAAAEMRRRICASLAAADAADPADSPNARRLQALVALVRDRDAVRGWNLASHPARLRISTIDALNASLARSQPYANGGQALREPTERPAPLYRRAARQVLALLGEEGPAGDAVGCLLAHLDNQPVRLENLLAGLLARRDQWLPILGAGAGHQAARGRLEAALARIVSHELERLEAAMPPRLLEELTEISQAAAANRGSLPPGGPGARHPLEQRLAWWRSTASTFLTQQGGWRARLDVRGGFPPAQGDLKRSALALLVALGNCPGLDQRLARIQVLPAPTYPEAQWQALQALLQVLPLAAAVLKLVFAEEGTTDFIEVAAEGRAALGTDESPSELALRVDWRIRHVLLDEFQDTSLAQYELLRSLTRGWSPGDGRTLFLVGDPMQSIYRFRQAEVRLFLETRDRGLPGVSLEFLRLTANFRSQAPVVDWVNRVFARVFPGQDDTVTSAVAFAPSHACTTRLAGPSSGTTQPATGVRLHATAADAPGMEAAAVLSLVQECLADWPGETIGILVRSRAHASEIVTALARSALTFEASDLVAPGRTAVAGDLLALAHALLHPADRLAWFALLRGPCAGLSLAELELLARAPAEAGLESACQDPAVLATLSADGRERVGRVLAAVRLARERLGQAPLRDVLEGLWIELGGPAHAVHELPVADLVLELISQVDQGGDCPDILAMDDVVRGSSAALPAARAPVQVLTIHKAKGLQFDTVIVPGLGRLTGRNRRPALLWEELALDDGRAELLLAPINASGEDADPLYEMLWRLQGEQADAEADRLLYVAATRACKRLHLFGQVPPARHGDQIPPPPPGSLLARLWPAIAGDWPDMPRAETAAALGDPTSAWITPGHWRLPAGWVRPPSPPGVVPPGQPPATPVLEPAFDWATAWAVHAGSVAHRWLQHIATVGVENFPLGAIDEARDRIRGLLVRAGVGSRDLDQAWERVRLALAHAVSDHAGRWILSSARAAAVNEYPLTVAQGGRFRRLVVDRSFVAEDGVRWIVDYKTGSHEGGDLAQFLRSEATRYAAALSAYRDAFQGLDGRPVQTALYFPLLRTLLPVEPAGGVAPGLRD